jgi:hypothetical protein
MVNLPKELRRALASATELLEVRAEIERALKASEAEIPKLIEQRLAASSKLAECEASSALTGTEDRDLKAARSALNAARERLDSAMARVSGLKRRRDSQMQQLAQVRAEVEAELPNFYEEAIREFRSEWSSACEIFGKTLARRFAIERATDQELDLLPPAAASEPVDLGELSVPAGTLRDLQAALLQIEAARASELREQRQPPSYDADGVFEFVRASNLDGHTYKAGDRVIGSQLGAAAFKFCVTSRLLRRLDYLVSA